MPSSCRQPFSETCSPLNPTSATNLIVPCRHLLGDRQTVQACQGLHLIRCLKALLGFHQSHLHAHEEARSRREPQARQQRPTRQWTDLPSVRGPEVKPGSPRLQCYTLKHSPPTSLLKEPATRNEATKAHHWGSPMLAATGKKTEIPKTSGQSLAARAAQRGSMYASRSALALILASTDVVGKGRDACHSCSKN